MTIWKLKKRSSGLGSSDWKPEGAGDKTLECTFVDPSPDGTSAVGLDGKLRIQAQVLATWERKPGAIGVFNTESHGVTDMRITLRRGNRVWMQGGGWVALDPMMALRHMSVPVPAFRVVRDPISGGVHALIDESIDAAPLGAGPLVVQVYLEGHPRELVQHKKHGWDPALAGTFSTTVMIDGESPETTVDEALPTGGTAFVIGHATDNHEVKHVLLSVIDEENGRYLDTGHRWTNRASAFKVPVDENGRWEWSFPPSSALPGSGNYRFEAQAEDTAVRLRTKTNKLGRGNVDPTPVVVGGEGES